MEMERKNPIESEVGKKEERQAVWDKKRLEVADYKDQAGNPMDEGIKETVIALNVNDIPTIQSCAGHLEKFMMPWVQISQPGRPAGIYKKSDITPEWENWKKEEEALISKVTQLLEEFSSGRKDDSVITLKLNESNQIIATSEDIEKIESGDTLGIKPLTKDDRVIFTHLIPLAQKEIDAFTIFLKRRFFETQ